VILETITGGQAPYFDLPNEFQISRFIADKHINPLEYMTKVKKLKVEAD
jgi:hypothetical protein